MNMHSEIYKRIRDNIIRTWPAWKQKIYNSCIAVSAHAEKIPEDDRTRSTPVWTNYDRLVSMAPNEMALWFAKTFGDEGDYNMWMKFLCAPADKEGE